jgi:uncharacterized protein
MNEKDETTIRTVLGMKTIAIVGLSDNPSRPSYEVALYLQKQGYVIIPVNPAIAEWRGIRAYPDLRSVPVPFEVVDIFRKPDIVPAIVAQAIATGARAVWMQEGIINESAAREATSAGLLVVMNKCMKKYHQALNKK